jgi:hypothetical protein
MPLKNLKNLPPLRVKVTNLERMVMLISLARKSSRNKSSKSERLLTSSRLSLSLSSQLKASLSRVKSVSAVLTSKIAALKSNASQILSIKTRVRSTL